MKATSPYLSIWFKPRTTLEHLIKNDPKRSVLALAALAGITKALNQASWKNMGDRMDTLSIILYSIMLGPIYGIFVLYVISAIIRSTGRMLSGTASALHMRTVLAWASLPIACELALWIPKLILGGSEMFKKRTPILDAKPELNIYFWAILIAEVLLMAWTFVIALKGTALAQNFSTWKAGLNLFLAFIFAIIFYALLIVITVGSALNFV